MKVIGAYLGVVLIWSTTPLAVQWSNSSLSFQAAATARMAIAAILCALILLVSRRAIVKDKRDVLSFIAGSIGIFPNMLLVYWSAQFIPSSLIAILFGTYPFFTGLCSIVVLKQNPFNVSRVVALFIALIGLVVIHADQLQLGSDAVYGVLGILTSSLLFSFSTVLVKKVGGSVDAFRQLSGSLFIAAPGFLLTWYLTDGFIPASIDLKSALGVAYLVLAGSMFGGVAFYYVLTNCQVVTVSLIPLLTPVVAIALGVLIEGEQIRLAMLIGAVCILFSLALYQQLFQRLYRIVHRRWKKDLNYALMKVKPLFV
ncbi:DMT family transporter [Agaribacterium sp. ZY112]|uniref:DMT family transporter n=1 Tax=Agaribacterium sp. ZY112 TaxID=3233574 RepID=UPI00352479C3